MKMRLLLPGCAVLFGSTILFGAEGAISNTDTYRRLKAKIDQIYLIDTHEHLGAAKYSEAGRLKAPADFLATMIDDYVRGDLAAAGLPHGEGRAFWQGGVQDVTVSLERRWTLFEKYWPEVRFTGHAKAFERSTRDLYGVRLDKLTPETAKELNRRIAEALKPGFYRWVLKERARIELAIVAENTLDLDREFFVGVLNFDDFVMVGSREQLDNLAKRTAVKIDTIDNLVTALDAAIQKGKRDGMVGIKSLLAYRREIRYPLPSVEEARAALAGIINGKPSGNAETLPLQNYMMNQLCRLAGNHQMPFQFHTGLQATGFGDPDITRANPTHLINLVKAYPETRFVIFHGGYPYGPELGVMAKNFTNVYIDMCWLHIISPKVSRDYLSEWIETVPVNKIMGFGGDSEYVELAYAHAELARENIAAVLTEKVMSSYMTEDDAMALAMKFLRTNAILLYRLPLR